MLYSALCERTSAVQYRDISDEPPSLFAKKNWRNSIIGCARILMSTSGQEIVLARSFQVPVNR